MVICTGTVFFALPVAPLPPVGPPLSGALEVVAGGVLPVVSVAGPVPPVGTVVTVGVVL